MSSSNDSESEILLGNKQLLAVFAVVAVLLAISFTGGYMVGKNNGEKKTTTASDVSGAGDSSVLVTRTVPPANAPDASASSEPKEAPHDDSQFVAVPLPAPDAKVTERPAAARKSQAAAPPSGAEANPVSASFTPEAGQTFLQVAAVGKDEADAVADVLHKKGFRAHSVQKPGSPKIYRVLIGPVKDAGDLAATRDLLRKTGFREVIVQHY
jgi:cell division septation protein DedD